MWFVEHMEWFIDESRSNYLRGGVWKRGYAWNLPQLIIKKICVSITSFPPADSDKISRSRVLRVETSKMT